MIYHHLSINCSKGISLEELASLLEAFPW